jgi:Flp pilus assembly protein TadB
LVVVIVLAALVRPEEEAKIIHGYLQENQGSHLEWLVADSKVHPAMLVVVEVVVVVLAALVVVVVVVLAALVVVVVVAATVVVVVVVVDREKGRRSKAMASFLIVLNK